jgi:hypothetical protein
MENILRVLSRHRFNVSEELIVCALAIYLENATDSPQLYGISGDQLPWVNSLLEDVHMLMMGQEDCV